MSAPAALAGPAPLTASLSCEPLTAAAKRAEARTRILEARSIGDAHAREHAHARAADRARACRPSPPRDASTVRRSLAVGVPAAVGRWSAGTLIPAVGIHTILLPTGKVLFLSHRSSTLVGVGYVYDPVTRTGRRVDPPADLFCADEVVMADGRVLVVGGIGGRLSSGDDVGHRMIFTFNPYDETWTRQPDTQRGRYYPTVSLLPDGRAVILSGRLSDSTTNSDDVEVFTPSPSINGVGTVQKVGSKYFTEYYPHAFVLPNGRLLVAGGRRADTSLLNPATWGWSDIPDMINDHREYASGVLLPGPPSGSWRVLRLGGVGTSGATHAGVEMFDASVAGATWTARAPMPEARHNHNTVILPDGTLLTVGGNGRGQRDLPYREARLYDPATNSWTAMADQAESRTYHSTAILLPDGRVLSAGDDGTAGGGGESDRVETFEPTYLFRTPRPTIMSAPEKATWGEGLAIGVTGDVRRAVLMGAPATTHALASQRHVELQITATSPGVVSVTAPPSSGVAPPGPYMLFVLNAEGVPSVARWVFLGAEPGGTDTIAPTVTARTPAPGATGAAVTGNVTVSFSEPIDAATVTGSSFRLTDSAGAVVPAAVSVASDRRSATLDPSASLAASATYSASLAATIKDASGNALAPETWSFATAAAPVATAYLESGGRVVMEAERFDARIGRSGKAWSTTTSRAGYVGTGAMVATPNSGSNINTSITTTSPEMQYRVRFATAGTYRIWVRGWAPGSSDNSAHVGLQGVVAGRFSPTVYGAWSWSTASATVSVPSAGTRTVNLWMREDGYVIDRVLLTTSTATPSGSGPAASPRG